MTLTTCGACGRPYDRPPGDDRPGVAPVCDLCYHAMRRRYHAAGVLLHWPARGPTRPRPTLTDALTDEA